MKIIIYTENLQGSQIRELERAVGARYCADSVLPMVVELDSNDVDLDDKLRTVHQLESSAAGAIVVILDTGTIAGLPLTEAEIIDTVGDHSEWMEFRESANVSISMIKFTVREYAECWLALVYDSRGGLPQGWGLSSTSILDVSSLAVSRMSWVHPACIPNPSARLG